MTEAYAVIAAVGECWKCDGWMTEAYAVFAAVGQMLEARRLDD